MPVLICVAVDFCTDDPYDSSMRLGRRGKSNGRGPFPTGGPGEEPDDRAPAGRPRRRYDPAWNDWNPPRRWPGILVSCVIVLGFMSAVVWHLRPHVSVHHATVVVNRGAAPPKPQYLIPVKGTRAISFSGTHDVGGLHFTSTGGLLVLHAKCLCQYNFVVRISNPSGVPITFPVNDTGHVDTVLNATVPLGPLVISVVGQGHWNLQFVQPLATTPVIATPFTLYSSSNDVIGPFSAANKYLDFKFLSLSDGTVAVHVLDSLGFGLQTPFEGRDSVSAAKALASLPNPYYLEIDAIGGYWNVEVGRRPIAN